MMIKNWYARYRMRKTLLKKMDELKSYIRPGYNVRNTAKRIAELNDEVGCLVSKLKRG